MMAVALPLLRMVMTFAAGVASPKTMLSNATSLTVKSADVLSSSVPVDSAMVEIFAVVMPEAMLSPVPLTRTANSYSVSAVKPLNAGLDCHSHLPASLS